MIRSWSVLSLAIGLFLSPLYGAEFPSGNNDRSNIKLPAFPKDNLSNSTPSTPPSLSRREESPRSKAQNLLSKTRSNNYEHPMHALIKELYELAEADIPNAEELVEIRKRLDEFTASPRSTYSQMRSTRGQQAIARNVLRNNMIAPADIEMADLLRCFLSKAKQKKFSPKDCIEKWSAHWAAQSWKSALIQMFEDSSEDGSDLDFISTLTNKGRSFHIDPLIDKSEIVDPLLYFIFCNESPFISKDLDIAWTELTEGTDYSEYNFGIYWIIVKIKEEFWAIFNEMEGARGEHSAHSTSQIVTQVSTLLQLWRTAKIVTKHKTFAHLINWILKNYDDGLPSNHPEKGDKIFLFNFARGSSHKWVNYLANFNLEAESTRLATGIHQGKNPWVLLKERIEVTPAD